MTLLHGTTRQRAESIISNGPDVRYREPGGIAYVGDFSAYVICGPFIYGPPEEYALKKHRLYSSEGGPVILELDVPDEIVQMADDDINPIACGTVQFSHEAGLTELLAAWSAIRPTCVIRSVP